MPDKFKYARKEGHNARDEGVSGEAGNDRPDTPVSRGGTRPKEIGGRGGLDPTRYGDWEKAGRCIDF